ncbi:MAG: hypothetical protein L6Q53_00280 [Candidatus Brocadia sinica]|nr:hypothetical protein [Candidatus Brocadia sinica]
MVVLEMEDYLYESILREASTSFPILDEEPKVEFVKRCGVQFGGYEDVLKVILDPNYLHWLIGALTIIGAPAVKKLLELAVEDSYRWLKSLLKKAAQKKADACKRGHPAKGLYLKILTRDYASIDTIFDIHYDPHIDDFDQQLLENSFRVFENIIRPLINFLDERAVLKSIIIDGYLEPARRNPQWHLFIKFVSKDSPFQKCILLGVYSDGIIDWSMVKGAETVREFLTAVPPFIVQKSIGLLHWKNCESLGTVSLIDMQTVPELSGRLTQSFKHCPVCRPENSEWLHHSGESED